MIRARWPEDLPHRDRLLLAVAALFWAIAVQRLASHAWGRALDDFFITFRYAENLATGHGFAFNPGERVFGTTAPGFGVLLALGRLLTRVSVPGLATASTAVALWLLGLVVLAELAKAGRRVEGALAGTWIVLHPFVWPQHGNEIPVALVLLLLAARFAERAPVSAGAAAALAVWCRPECMIGALALAGLEIRRAVATGRAGRVPGRYLATLGAVLLAAAAFDLATMGSLLPITLAAKRAQAVWLPHSFVSGWGFWAHALRPVSEMAFGPTAALALALGVAGVPILWSRGGPACRMLVLQTAGLAIAYPALGVADYPWYAIPFALTASVGAPLAAGALVRGLLGEAAARPFAARAGAALAAASLLLPVALVWPERVEHAYATLSPNHHYELYRRTGEWLRANTPAGATVAYVEVGTIGYFSERSVQDLLGLVTPRAVRYVSTGDMEGAFLSAPAEYLLFDRYLIGFIDPIRKQPWFVAAYRRVTHLDSEHGPPERVVIYGRRPGSAVPAPREPLTRAEVLAAERDRRRAATGDPLHGAISLRRHGHHRNPDPQPTSPRPQR